MPILNQPGKQKATGAGNIKKAFEGELNFVLKLGA